MTVLRERMVEPENAITTTPLRPEDDYFPRERRASGVPFCMEPGSPVPNPNTFRLTTCLLRNDKGLGFSIAGGKGSTPYRTGDTVSGSLAVTCLLLSRRPSPQQLAGSGIKPSPSCASAATAFADSSASERGFVWVCLCLFLGLQSSTLPLVLSRGSVIVYKSVTVCSLINISGCKPSWVFLLLSVSQA